MRWCFWSHLVLRCTNRHQNKPIAFCLYSRDGAFNCNLYFDVQTGTKTNLSLVVYVYEVVLLLASCTLVYKRLPEQAYFFSCLSLWDGAFTRILYVDVQTGTKSNQFFSCLCLWGGAFSRIFYFDVQTGTKTNLFQFMFTGWCFYSHFGLLCTNRHQNKPIFNCLCLRSGAFTRILYFGVQTCNKTSLF